MSGELFEKLVKATICNYIIKNAGGDEGAAPKDPPKAVVIVWQSKVLQNNKAIAITIDPYDDTMYEVTYDGDKRKVYLDVYKKVHNSAEDVIFER